MRVLIDNTFDKDISSVKNKSLLAKVDDVIERLEVCSSLDEIASVKKLKGSKDCYRIRVGDYRIGLRKNKDDVILIRFLNRKDIYRYFP